MEMSVLLALYAGNSPVTGEFPSQRPVTRSFVFFDLRLNKRLSKQSGGGEGAGDLKPHRAHYDVIVMKSSGWSYTHHTKEIENRTTQQICVMEGQMDVL